MKVMNRTLLLLFFTVQLYAQQGLPAPFKTGGHDSVFCDCRSARVVTLNSKTSINKTIAPKGYGNIKEISNSKQNTGFAFEKEHNTAWYKLLINVSGTLIFDITPSRPNDDYDFMLFKSAKNNFCDSLLNHKISPVRACISRNKKEISGKTGLGYQSKEEFIKQGIAAAYAKPIEVKRGEIYYLVLDNVYEKGEGHMITFEIAQSILVKGVVVNELNKPVQAEIALTNQDGDTVLLQQTKTDGSFNFTAPVMRNRSYLLNFYNDSSFNFTRSFSLADTSELKSLKTVLPKLKKGSKYSVGAINFVGGSVEYLRGAIPAMHNLYRLLKKNPNLKIVIIGHSNGRDMQDESGIIAFTKGRATSVKNYLWIQGIDEKRIEVEGKGDYEMLFKLPGATVGQQEKNRRVEIRVLDY